MPLTPCLFSKKSGPIMPPHQTVTRFGCVGFSMYACGFSVPQIYLFTCPPRSKWASSEKMIFLPKSSSSVSRSQAHFPVFGRRIKLIICQVWHELSVTIREISTSWKKTLDGGQDTNRPRAQNIFDFLHT